MPKIINPYPVTKLGKILEKRNMNYRDFQLLVYEKTGYYMAFDRISKIISGKQRDMLYSTVKNIADALDLKVEDVL